MNTLNLEIEAVLAPTVRREYQVWDCHANKQVGENYTNLHRASRRVDVLDNAYGAYRYTVRPVMVRS